MDDVAEPPTPVSPPPNRPRPMTSLVASAQRITASKLAGGAFKRSTGQGWQEDAWEMFDLVGEERFLATTLANRMGQARWYVGKMPEDPLADPVPAEDETLQHLLDTIGGGIAGRTQIVQRLGVNLFVVGDGWLVGIPKGLMPKDDGDEDTDEELAVSAEEANMADLVWRMLSTSEIKFGGGGEVQLLLGEAANEQISVNPDDVYLIRVWRPHPRRWWEADSPTRSSLPVLRELVGLTMHISAQVDSRLAGAGLLIVPESVVKAMKRAAGMPEDSPDDPFTDALLAAMMTPIADRSSAAAIVPLVVIAPDGTTEGFKHMSFSQPLDAASQEMRDEAIRRLALGQDAPPELLLGTGSLNHWGAWLVKEDVVNTHIEPPLALIADALTQQYLRPVMAEMGEYTEAQIEEYVVWYDVNHMIIRPNRATDAQALYDRGVISDDALRNANGFDESDAPGAATEEGGTTEQKGPDEAALKAIDIVLAMPDLMRDPGLPAVVEQVRTAMFPDGVPTTQSAAADAAETEQADEEIEDVKVQNVMPAQASDADLDEKGFAAIAMQLGVSPDTLREWWGRQETYQGGWGSPSEIDYRDYGPEAREKAAEKGNALPDGSFPINNCVDLGNAIQASGRAKDQGAVQAHIRRRKRELECDDVDLPSTWAVTGPEDELDDNPDVVEGYDVVMR